METNVKQICRGEVGADRVEQVEEAAGDLSCDPLPADPLRVATRVGEVRVECMNLNRVRAELSLRGEQLGGVLFLLSVDVLLVPRDDGPRVPVLRSADEGEGEGLVEREEPVDLGGVGRGEDLQRKAAEGNQSRSGR